MKELVERIYAQWGQGDYSNVEILHPEYELTFAPGFLEEGTYKGRQEAWRGWSAWLAGWESWTYEAVRYFELDDGRIATFIDIDGVNRSTGLPLRQASANLWEFEDGLLRRLRIYAHRDDMIRELGLDAA